MWEGLHSFRRTSQTVHLSSQFSTVQTKMSTNMCRSRLYHHQAEQRCSNYFYSRVSVVVDILFEQLRSQSLTTIKPFFEIVFGPALMFNAFKATNHRDPPSFVQINNPTSVARNTRETWFWKIDEALVLSLLQQRAVDR